MAVVAQSADLAHAEHRLAPAGAEVGLALGQAPGHGFAAPRWRGVPTATNVSWGQGS